MRSVRARVTLLGVLLIGVTLAAAGVLLHVTMERQLTRSGDQLSLARAHELATAPVTPVIQVGDDGVAQVVADDGTVLAASPNIAGKPRIASFRPESSPASVVGPDDAETETYRLWAVRGEDITAYVGRSLESEAETLRTLTLSLLVGLPLLTALCGAALWFLVGRMLGRLDEAAARERHFVGNASHELLGPVAALRTQLEVAREHPSGADWQELSGDLLDDTLGMERLVKDLLLLARSENGAGLRHEPVDLALLVHEVAPGVPVRGSLTVTGDHDALARLVRNLVDNAQRHAQAQVEVVLGDGRMVVSDDGPGVPAEHRARVFDRFFQADPARSRQVAGAGLGLAIARSIAERHGGTLELAESSRLGGADFVVRFS